MPMILRNIRSFVRYGRSAQSRQTAESVLTGCRLSILTHCCNNSQFTLYITVQNAVHFGNDRKVPVDGSGVTYHLGRYSSGEIDPLFTNDKQLTRQRLQ